MRSFPTTSRIASVVKAPVSMSPLADASEAVNASCANVITPTCLQEIYGIPSTPATQSSNRIAVAGYDDQWANIADLEVSTVPRVHVE